MVEITLSKTKIFENHEELLKRGGTVVFILARIYRGPRCKGSLFFSFSDKTTAIIQKVSEILIIINSIIILLTELQ